MKRREFERTTPEAVGLRSEDIDGCWTSWKAALLRCTA